MEIRYIEQVPELAPILRNADHVDVKCAEGEVTMRQFLASLSSYRPAWLRFLFQVRAGFARLLGIHHGRDWNFGGLRPAEVPMTTGGRLAIFTVDAAKEDHHWIAHVTDQHLDVFLGVVVEPRQRKVKRFHLFTVVRYNNWKGPVYFNVIRPFHHLVVGSMARAGVKEKD